MWNLICSSVLLNEECLHVIDAWQMDEDGRSRYLSLRQRENQIQAREVAGGFGSGGSIESDELRTRALHRQICKQEVARRIGDGGVARASSIVSVAVEPERRHGDARERRFERVGDDCAPEQRRRRSDQRNGGRSRLGLQDSAYRGRCGDRNRGTRDGLVEGCGQREDRGLSYGNR